ncbi:MAG: 2-oxoacid:acceptor oxidoreductase subunit alpha [Bacillota bacterium]|nr:2-oxoacid:acceptor oxidoreductase subunit alpha [Bacillota bacterium]
MFMQGNEALFRGAVAAGGRFYAGYPITPSSEIAELAAQELPKLGGVYLQMEDELASIAAVIGASLAGVPAFTATSGPGFSLMQENLGVAYMAEIPCVVINVMRSGPSTGLATMPAQADVMQARWGTHGDHPALALCPASVQECFELSALAFTYSEQLRMPVTVLADEIIGHLREPLEVPVGTPIASRPLPSCPPGDYGTYDTSAGDVPPLGFFGGPHIVHANSSMHDAAGQPTTRRDTALALIRRLQDKVTARSAEFPQRRWYLDDAEWVFVSFGISARASLAAVERLRSRGVAAGLLQIQTVWPFPRDLVREVCRNARGVFVVELSLGQLVGEVERAVMGHAPVHLIAQSDGRPLLPGDICRRAGEVAGDGFDR